MKFAKYVLSGVCLSIMSSGNVWAVYAGEDPEVSELKEQVKKLEGQINEMKEADKQFDVRAQGIEEKLKSAAGTVKDKASDWKDRAEERAKARKEEKEAAAAEAAEAAEAEEPASVDEAE